MSAIHKNLLTSKMPPKSSLQGGRLRGHRNTSTMDFTPVSWNKYFTDKKDVSVKGNSFRVYTLGDSGPVLCLIHGGGFSGLSWSLLSAMLNDMVDCRIVALDLRGHGDTHTSADSDLSIQTLARDVCDVLEELYGEIEEGIVLVGHSVGGAVAVHAAQELGPLLRGVIVIDVVEGTALSALSSMQAILRARPLSFHTIEDAIKWSVQSGQVKNLESARISMPGQIKNSNTDKTGTEEIESDYVAHYETSDTFPERIESIRESEEAEFKRPVSRDAGAYVWRIDLRKTESHWAGWFQGLSKLFLSLHAQKLLLLASLDRLDTDLTVAHMQGKFEVHAFEQSRGRCGHIVHEDIPDAVAEVIATYLIRNKFANSKGSFTSPMPCC